MIESYTVSSLLLLSAACLVTAGRLSQSPTAADDLVVNLPGLGNLGDGYKQYSGYLNGGNGRMLHYWFIESQKKPARDPLLLWMNGGPGCSSLDGLLTELGPFTVNDDGTLENNPFSWNTIANIIYLESPVCVGYSYNSGSSNCQSSDDSTAEQNYNALKDFFARFPSYLSNEFFVIGESFGGIYVPMLTDKIIAEQESFPINLKGFAVGNGLSNYAMNDDSLIFYANYHGLFGKDLWDNLVKHCCPKGKISETDCNFSRPSNSDCTVAVSKAMGIIYNGGINVYDLYSDCQSSPIRGRSLPHMRNLFRGYTKVSGMERSDPPCLNYMKETRWLDSEEVRTALHIPKDVQYWSVCSDAVGILYVREYFDMTPQYHNISKAGVRGLLYNGDTDMACNFIGEQWFAESLGYKETEAHRSWMSGGQVGGFVKRFELLDLLTVRGSGHMVPEDKPAQALDMIKAFIFNTGY